MEDDLPHRSLIRLALLGVLAVGGCSALPASGPEERDILKSERSEANRLGFHIVPVTEAVTSVLEADGHGAAQSLSAMAGQASGETIGPGDQLQISVFEIGSGLFAGGGQVQTSPGSAGISTSATRENLPTIEVDSGGFISVPYVGRLRVAGRTAPQVQGMIEAGLASHSQDPQVVVEVTRNVANNVIVAGEVAKPGRVPLTLAHERLLDVIALSGGPTHPAQDMIVRVSRKGALGEATLPQIEANEADDIAMQPRDRVQLINRPRTYTVFGATRVSEVPFTAERVSLAEAIARAGGPLDERADPNAVFLFRYETPDVARQVTTLGASAGPPAMVPVIYHLDLIQTDSYFLAQQIPMRDKDLIYIANARTTGFGKLLGFVSALFTPAIVTHSLSTGNSF